MPFSLLCSTLFHLTKESVSQYHCCLSIPFPQLPCISLSVPVSVSQYLVPQFHFTSLAVSQILLCWTVSFSLSVPVSHLHSTSPSVPCLAAPCLTVPVPAAPVMLHCVVPSAAVQQLRGQRDNLYSYTGFARYFTFSPNFSSLGISSFSDFNPGYFLLVIPPPA